MKIGNQEIGPGHTVYVIAEIGVNHDGSVTRAIELVAHAKAAGADAVKLQVFRADTLVHQTAEFAEYQKTRVDAADPAEMLRQYELDDAGLKTVAEAAEAAGLQLICTPFSPSDVERAAAVSAAMKIASPDLVNRLLLTRVIATGLPMIVSTGAATFEEIESAAAWLTSKAATFAMLHCVSHYPVDAADANLSWISGLSRFGVPVGYSDHVADAAAGALAVACGASIVEKHLTYDTNAAGPDHSASLDPAGFTDYVRRIRQAEMMLGTGRRRVLSCENDVRRVSRQSLVAARDIASGNVISPDDLTTKRPGTGLSAERFEATIGQRASRLISRGEMLQAGDIDG
ncbi:MAG: N-acetylneuraminate synthase family protein [Tepidisphaeraceae bacterium]